jgi:hypothetical protein
MSPGWCRAVCGMPGRVGIANEIVNNLADEKVPSNPCLDGIKIMHGG